MDRAYESDETRQLVLELNMIPVDPPEIQPTRALELQSPTLPQTQ